MIVVLEKLYIRFLEYISKVKMTTYCKVVCSELGKYQKKRNSWKVNSVE